MDTLAAFPKNRATRYIGRHWWRGPHAAGRTFHLDLLRDGRPTARSRCSPATRNFPIGRKSDTIKVACGIGCARRSFRRSTASTSLVAVGLTPGHFVGRGTVPGRPMWPDTSQGAPAFGAEGVKFTGSPGSPTWRNINGQPGEAECRVAAANGPLSAACRSRWRSPG